MVDLVLVWRYFTAANFTLYSIAIAKVYQMLKPGGIFVTSTMCMGDTMGWFKLIAKPLIQLL